MDSAALVAPLAAAPASTALLFDVDGTLAPIVARPELARVPEPTRAELERLRDRYLLVACVSGRSGIDARRVVGVDGIRYVGNHGLELDPRARALAPELARFRERAALRWPVEDKGLTLSFHFRGADDEDAARGALAGIEADALAAGLAASWGRKVLEVRPAVAADKGTAVRALLAGASARLGLYAGDDTTDLDAFRGLAEAELERAIRVAVASGESPGDLVDAADLVLAGPEEVPALLRLL